MNQELQQNNNEFFSPDLSPTAQEKFTFPDNFHPVDLFLSGCVIYHKNEKILQILKLGLKISYDRK